MTTRDQRARMIALGAHVRAMRQFVGLTQQQLADAANVSQGAISRLEGGGGLATPYLTVLLAQQCLCQRLRALATNVELAPQIQELLTHPSMLPDDAAPVARDAVTADPTLGRYLEAFRRVPAPVREHLLTIVDTIAAIAPMTRAAGAAS